MNTLTLERIQKVTQRPLKPPFADEACRVLGGLARWWLREKVLERAREFDPTPEDRRGAIPPALPTVQGSCWMICAIRVESEYLRPAVVLPLCWRENTGHSPLLPEKLHSLADRVLEQVRKIDLFKDLFAQQWGLHPAHILGLTQRLDDSLFDTVDSGWAALAAGLLAAGQQLSPLSSVWASVQWHPENKLTRVSGLPEKLALAVEWKTCSSFYVHWSQVGEAENWVAAYPPAKLEIHPMGSSTGRGEWDALRSIMAAFTDEPSVPDPNSDSEESDFLRCRSYFLNLPAFSKRASDFYYSHLLASIVSRYRSTIRDRCPDLRVSRFVTIVSPSSELAVMSAQALDAEQCLLLHTPGKMEKIARECAVRLGADRCKLSVISENNVVEEIGRAVAEFTEDVPQNQVVLDLKPGSKKMTYAIMGAAHPENHLLNLEPKFLDDRRNVPGTEIPELLEPIYCHHPKMESVISFEQ